MMSRSIMDVQRDFALSSGFRSEIIWDSLSIDQSDILKEKIKTLIPDNEKQKEIEKLRQIIFKNVWAQRKYTNRNLLSAIIYVLVTEETGDSPQLSTSFTCHFVFRTRKCLNANNSTGCCMVFIDEQGRTYNNWNQYLKKNTLPRGTLVAPANGVYTFDDNNEVQLECHVTPATSRSFKILNATDAVASVGGLMASVPIAVALTLPVAAPVMLAATTVAISTAAYTTVRSALQLTDRHQHSQSVALTNPAARNSWLGMVGGVVGIGATGATKALTYVSTAGREISLAAKIAVNGVNVSSIVISGTGIINGAYDLYVKINDDEDVSRMDVLQLAASLVIFTHSLNNLKIASKVVTKKGGSTVRNELTTQMRSIFDGIYREASNLHGSPTASADIIRTFNDIPVGETLLSLHRTNPHLVAVGAEFGTSLLHKICLHFNKNMEGVNIEYLVEEFGTKFVQHIRDLNSFLDVLNAMATYFCEKVLRFLLQLAKTFIEDKVDIIHMLLDAYISTETVIYKILMHCVNKYHVFSLDYLESKTLEILETIENYFKSLNSFDYNDKPRNCKACKGHYYICTL